MTSPSSLDTNTNKEYQTTEKLVLLMADIALRSAGGNREAVWHASAMLTRLGMLTTNVMRAKEYLELAESIIRNEVTSLDQSVIDVGIGVLPLTDMLIKPPDLCHECSVKYLCLASSMERGDQRTACVMLACVYTSTQELKESIISALVKGFATSEQVIGWLELAEGSPL